MKAIAVDVAFSGPFGLAEGIVWSVADQALLWVDITGRAVFRGHPESGWLERFAMPTEVGFGFPAADGRILVGLNHGLTLFDPATGGLIPLIDPKPHRAANRFNDAALDRTGRLWAGTMPIDGPGARPAGSVYCFCGGTAVRCFAPFWIQNGLGFSPDGRRGYVSDSHVDAQMIWRFDLDSAGTPGARIPFFDPGGIAGRPDCACVDAEGCYWTAANDGWQILRITPAGKLDRAIALPVAKPTKLAFGGRGLDTLFVTSMAAGFAPDTPPDAQPLAGAVLALRPGICGLADAPVTGLVAQDG